MKTFRVPPQMNIQITPETKAKVVQTVKNGAGTVGEFLGAVGGAFVTMMAHEANCRQGIHEFNSFGTCKHCYKRLSLPQQVVMVGGIPAIVVPQSCNHTWAKADSSNVSCLNCGKRLFRFSWDKDEAAWAKAILAQLE
jgi:hypothetical protein